MLPGDYLAMKLTGEIHITRLPGFPKGSYGISQRMNFLIP
jgi:hypothetical protein